MNRYISEYTGYLASVEKSLQERIWRGEGEKFGNGVIERLKEGGFIKGYRFSNVEGYAFYDVYWLKVSDHFLIQERSRRRVIQERSRRSVLNWATYKEPKPIFGPIPIEILESDVNEESVDQRCLELLKERVKRSA